MKPKCAKRRLCKIVSCYGREVNISEYENVTTECSTLPMKQYTTVWTGKVLFDITVKAEELKARGIHEFDCETALVGFCEFIPSKGQYLEIDGFKWKMRAIKSGVMQGETFTECIAMRTA